MLDVEVVFDHAPPPRLVPHDANGANVGGSVRADEVREAPSAQLALGLERINGKRDGRKRWVRGCAEGIADLDRHATTSAQSPSSRSICPASENWRATRSRAAAPRRIARARSPMTRSRAAATERESPGAASKPVTPSSTSSGTPPTA